MKISSRHFAAAILVGFIGLWALLCLGGCADTTRRKVSLNYTDAQGHSLGGGYEWERAASSAPLSKDFKATKPFWPDPNLPPFAE